MFAELDPAELYVPVDPNKIPKFLNKPSTYQVVTKDTIVLPCEVYNPGKFRYRDVSICAFAAYRTGEITAVSGVRMLKINRFKRLNRI